MRHLDSRARVRCVWANSHCDRRCTGGAGRASYHIKGKIYRACVQSVFTYWTETWAMKARNLHSLERREQSV